MRTTNRARRRATTTKSNEKNINWTGKTKPLYEQISLFADGEGIPYWRRMTVQNGTKMPTDESGPISTKIAVKTQAIEKVTKDGKPYTKYEVVGWSENRGTVLLREFVTKNGDLRWMITKLGTINTGFAL